MSPIARIGVLDSGLGLTSYADALFHFLPDADLYLGTDPEHSPYGALSVHEVQQRALASARDLARHDLDALVVACNTASVHALGTLREVFEPHLPVIGTVPAVKSAAATGEPFAVWATDSTTRSDYLRSLIEQFAREVPVTPVSCPGLAEAIDAADDARIDACLDSAAARTPRNVGSVVLGCTHYGLVADRIMNVLPGTSTVFDSPRAVALQTLRRLGLEPHPDDGEGVGAGRIHAIYASGALTSLPGTLAAYPPGRRLLARQ